MRFIFIVLLFLAAAWWLIYGLSEHAFFTAMTDMLTTYFSGVGASALIHYAVAALIVAVGLILAWPIRPTFLRRRYIKLFLERDSGSDHYGIHSFPDVTYVQPSLTTSVPLTSCRAWATKVEYRITEHDLYAIEHNERHPFIWSKHGGRIYMRPI